MGNQYGYFVDLAGKSFSDSEPTWIQALPLGTYEHPEYGKIEVTPEKIQQFAANVAANVRGQDLDIDYDHKAAEKVAAGWVKAADARSDGLWLQIDWTQRARKHLGDKEYRYFSPEFIDEWKHPATGVVHKNVLFGGALTNRPFLKGILPINLSEMMMADDDNKPPGGGGGGDGGDGGDGAPKSQSADKVISELAKLLKLEGSASPDLVLGALQVKLGIPGNDDPNDPANPDGGEGGAAPKPPAPAKPPMMSEGGKPVTIELSEEDKKNPTLVKMAEMLTQQTAALTAVTEQNKTLSEAAKIAEVDKQLRQFSEGNVVLAPVVLDEARKVLLAAPTDEARNATLSMLKSLSEGKGTVELSERGHASTSNGEPSGAVKEFQDAVAKVQKDNPNMHYTDAVKQVSSTQIELSERYIRATSLGEN